MKTKSFFIVFSLLSFLYSCNSDDGNSNNSADNDIVKIIVVDENNAPVPNAKIVNGNTEITTNASGVAEITNPAETYGKYRFGVTKDGHFPGSLNVDPYNINPEGYTVMLLGSASTETIPSTGGTVSGYDWTFTSTGGFVHENGSPVNGNVDIAIRYIHPDNLEEIQAAFPGGDFWGVGGGIDIQLYVYGFVAISYTQNGVRVYPAVGSVTITVQVPGVYANAAQDGGKVFYYDEEAQIWEESANPTVSGLHVTMPLPSRTTFCCFGKGYPIARIKYIKSACDGDDGYIYTSRIEWEWIDYNILGHTYTSIVNGSSGWGYTITYNNNGTVTYSYEYNGNHIQVEQYITVLANFNYDFKVKINRALATQPIGQFNSEDIIVDEYTSFPAGITNIGNINTVCSGGENPFDNNNPTQGQGQYAINGATYSGDCVSVSATQCSSGIDVVIMSSSGGLFTIYNMPQASNGTYNFTAFQYGGCNLFTIYSGNYTASTGGTLTKTGAKTFTFTCTLSDSSVITGSGTYN